MKANVLAHQRYTGPEIWQESNGHVDVFLDFVGTGGCYTGVMRYLLECKPPVRGYVVEPANAAALAGCGVPRANHKIQAMTWPPRECREISTTPRASTRINCRISQIRGRW